MNNDSAGGPMIMRWHREVLRFLETHRQAFQHIPLAVFVMALTQTETGEMSVEGVPACVDEGGSYDKAYGET
jgi:menaquinone-dependent protoporphyrinogen IX oxidase